MNRYIISTLIIILLLCGLEPVSAQESKIEGRVMVPLLKKKERTFRGNVYRNRSLAGKKKTSGDEVAIGVTDAIVSAHPLSFIPELPVIPDTAQLYQQDAVFVPHVLPVVRGTIVQIINLDNIYHNVFSLTPGSRFNIGRRPKGDVVSQKIDKLGEIKCFCDIHVSMNSIILSLDTPYFTRVQLDGTYSLAGLPAGTYEIRIYHPDLPMVKEQVTVADQTVRRDFTLTP